MIRFRNQRKFRAALRNLSQDMHDSAVIGIHEALGDWLKRGREKAPEDIKFLKSEMKTEISRGILEGYLHSNAYSRGFNYAYFLHEVGSKKGYKPRKPGKSLTWIADTQNDSLSWAIAEKAMWDNMKAKGW